MRKLLFTLFISIFCVFNMSAQTASINWISPDNGDQGEYLNVTISGNNIDYGGQWSGTNLSDFRFSQWSGSNMFYGNTTSESGNYLYGNVNIPQNQNPGYYDLEVYDQNSNQWIQESSAFYVNYSAPQAQINWISPSSGDQGQTLSVTISGTNMNYGDQWSGTLSDFRFSQWSGSNMFYGNSTSESGNYLYGDVSIPSGQNTGWYDLEVYDQNSNQWIQESSAFYVDYSAPQAQINWISPSSGDQGQTLSVTISGTNMNYGDQWSGTLSDFRFKKVTGGGSGSGTGSGNGSGGQSGGYYTFSSSGTFTSGNYLYGNVSIPNSQPAGDYDLEVYDYNTNDWVQLDYAFYVNYSSPSTSINWISPDNGEQGENLSVTISGNNICYGDQWSGTLSDFRFSQYSGSNMFYGTATGESGNELYGYVNIPQNQNTGWYDLEVYDQCSGNWIVSNDAFYLSSAPQTASINWISPDNGDQGEYLNVTISGNNIDYGGQWSGTNLSDFRFSQWSGSNMFYGNTTSESGNYLYGNVNIPQNQNPGYYDLEVYDQNSNQWIQESSAFYVNYSAPQAQINWISPSSGDQGQTLSVTISGTNMNYGDQWSGTLSDFRFSQWSGSNMFYGNSTSESGNYLYGNVSIPNSQPTGDYDLEVYDYNTNQWVQLDYAFYVNYSAPQTASIDWISPDSANVGEYLNVTISGNNICYGDQWSGTLSDFRFSQYSGSNMFYGTATGETGNELYGYVDIPQNQDTGWYDLEVWNDCGGWVILTDAFYVGQEECQEGEATVQIFTNYQCGYYAGSFAFRIEDDQGNNILEGGYIAGESWQDSTYYNYCFPISDSCSNYNLKLIDGDSYGWYGCSEASALIISPAGDTLLYVEGDGGWWWEQSHSFSTEISGCTDPSANNYDPNAVCDDGSCCYQENANLQIFTNDQCGYYAQWFGFEIEDENGNILLSGGYNSGESWQDSTYYNYCVPILDTCENYNLILYVDYNCNGWNICSEATALITKSNGDTLLYLEGSNGCFQNFSFSSNIIGCTDPAANNYDPDAVCDDGSCCYGNFANLQVFTNNQCGYASELGWELEENGIVVASGGYITGEEWDDNSYYNYCLPVPLNNSCDIYNLILYSNWCDGWEICDDATAIITGINGDTLLFATEFNHGCNESYSFTVGLQGCIDSVANNYNPNAICDDGSCCYNDPIIDMSQLTWSMSLEDCDETPQWIDYFDEVIFNNDGTGYIVDSTDWGFTDYFNWHLCGNELIFNFEVGDMLSYFGNNNSLTFNMNGSTFTGAWFEPWDDEFEDGWCITLYPTIGCMDPTAYNYIPTALSSDSSCQYCTIDVSTISIDPSSIYNCDGSAFAIVNDNIGYVEYNWSTGDEDYFINGICAGVYTVQVTDSVGCTASDTFTIVQNGVVFGCTDISAENYDATATIDDGSCVYCSLSVVVSTVQNTSNGACDGVTVVYATTNNGTLNYLWNNGSTDFYQQSLCTGLYTVIVSDSLCSETVSVVIGQLSGCTDSSAINYDPYVTNDDGSCIYPIYGCTDPTAFNYDASANTDNGGCTPIIYGCTDMSAYNYNSSANTDDNSCQYCDLSTSLIIYENSQNNCDGLILANTTSSNSPISYIWNNGSTINNITNLCAGTYTVIITDAVGCLIDTTIIIGSPAIYGCTDPTADNYYTSATVDDGSCTYSSACNEDAPTGLFVDGIIHSRAVINWDNMNSSTCTVDQYRIRFREVGTTSWIQKTMGGPVGSCTWGNQRIDKLLLGLTGATTYEYEMKAWYCGGGSSAWTGLSTFTTADNCPNVGNLAAYGATTTKATFTWDASNGVYEFVRLKSRVDSISNPTGSDWFQIGGAGVAYGTYTKDKNGLVAGETYRAQARAFCDPNGGAYFSLTWTPLVYWTQPVVRVEGGTAIANLDVYPNPSRDVFNISFTSETIQDLKVRVLNVVGEVIISEDLDQFVGEYTKQINLHENAKGIYLLEIETNDGVVNKKLILQ